MDEEKMEKTGERAFVTHKSMMAIPTPTVWTPPWYATIPDLMCIHAVPVLLKI